MFNSPTNGTASPPRVERGKSLAHRTLATKAQRAVKAANVYDGLTVFQPTQVELARIYGVSVSLIMRARQLSLEQRKRVALGLASLPRPAQYLAPLKTSGASVDERSLYDLIANVGVEKVLTIAAAVDQARPHH
jgi:hypothetical protein